MPYFAFRLDRMAVRFQRGKIPDDDLVSLAVLVNQQDRGHRWFLAGAMTSGSTLAFASDPRIPTEVPAMFVGPFDLHPGDGVTVTFSAMNLSDSQIQLDAQKMDVLEAKLLSTLLTAAVGALVGEVAADLAAVSAKLRSALGSALGLLADPVGSLLGVHPEGPCNGLVFADGIQYNAAALASLSYTAQGKPYQACAFTRSYDDAATHDTNVCGHVAQTDVTWSVLKFDTLSVRQWADLFHVQTRLALGLRQLATPEQALSVRGLFVH